MEDLTRMELRQPEMSSNSNHGEEIMSDVSASQNTQERRDLLQTSDPLHLLNVERELLLSVIQVLSRLVRSHSATSTGTTSVNQIDHNSLPVEHRDDHQIPPPPRPLSPSLFSYEENLALAERIGVVKIGLPEETIHDYLKTRKYTFAKPKNSVQETEICVVCQDEYKDQEIIGKLDCGHEYHTNCIKKWLLIKNVCPLCKREALKI